MTLIKPRDPMTVAGAAARVIELVGSQSAADHIERGVSIVYKWANPDDVAQPVMHQAMALDELCSRYGETPFLDAYTSRMSRIQHDGCMKSATRKFAMKATELCDLVHEALEDDVLTPNEVMQIRQCLAPLQRKLNVIDGGCEAKDQREAAE